MPKIELSHVAKRWGKFYAVDDLNIIIDDNAFVTLLGPSGCGKTTTLRMIAGLETPTSGRITIGDQVVFDSAQGINIPPNKRKVGFLFQNYALWPNMTVYQNISFGLNNIKEEMPAVSVEAQRTLQLLQILEKPAELIQLCTECYDKNQTLDTERALLKLIDQYDLSVYTAKHLLGYRLHEEKHAAKLTQKKVNELEQELKTLKEKFKDQSIALDEDGYLLKNGRPLTKVRKFNKEEIDLTVRRTGRLVKIGMFMDRYPSELSGGQQQRVAITRTLAPNPKVLFMDEPLSNLDAKLRLEMRSELQRLHLETGSTFIYVTHDQMEAMTLATKICLLDNGLLQQYDKPLTIYNRPDNLFVADFVGNPAVNFVQAKKIRELNDGSLKLGVFDDKEITYHPEENIRLNKRLSEIETIIQKKEEGLKQKQAEKKYVEKENKDLPFRFRIALAERMELTDEDPDYDDDDLLLGIRPEYIDVSEDGALEAEVYSVMPTGLETTVRLRIGNYLLTGVIFGAVLYQIGQHIRVNVTSDQIMLFSCKNGQLISLGSVSF